MSKYVDAERLRAELERLHKAHSGKYGCDEVGLNLEHLEDFIDSLQQEQPEVDYNEFEKLFKDFCERNKGHHITSHDACMWFWELGLNARKEEK